MNQYLSDKIKVLSFLLIVFVLYIHSGFHADEIAGFKVIAYTQNFISSMLGRCAVPLFYIISGYLFYLNIPNGIVSIIDKIKKRIKSLVLPYILSALFFVAFGVSVALVPGTNRFMNSSILSLFNENWLDILIKTFYGKNGSAPMAFQLWFLRDLIILVLFSPIWYFLYKYFKWYWLLLVLIFNIIYPIQTVPLLALLWFGIGGYLKNFNLNHTSKFVAQTSTLVFLALCFLQLSTNSFIWEHLTIPIIALGIVAIWYIYDYLVLSDFDLTKNKLLCTCCSFTFFIYLYHEPTLNIVRKLIVYLVGKNEIGSIHRTVSNIIFSKRRIIPAL